MIVLLAAPVWLTVNCLFLKYQASQYSMVILVTSAAGRVVNALICPLDVAR